MEPPSYEDACVQPPPSVRQADNVPPPPSYHDSRTGAQTPPPTYREAVTTQSDPFPLLTTPTVPTDVTSQYDDVTVHPLTTIGAIQPVGNQQFQQVPVIVTQPPPVLISPVFLTDIPGVVNCPYCHEVVSTKIKRVPGNGAWCWCIMLTSLGLVCGFCLIPLMLPALQDVHHFCPKCSNCLHIYQQ